MGGIRGRYNLGFYIPSPVVLILGRRGDEFFLGGRSGESVNLSGAVKACFGDGV